MEINAPRAHELPGEGLEALVRFIARAFEQRHELKRFVRQLQGGDELLTTLPGDIASPENAAYALTAAVTSRGLLDADFFALLLRLRPRMSAQINEIRQRCLLPDEPAGTMAPGVLLRSGRYKLEELIDHGAVASVWRAFDRLGHKPVAIKVLRRDMRDYKLRRWQFIKGANHLAAISHPQVARVLEPHFNELGHDFCVLQFVQGRSLADVVRAKQLSALHEVTRVILDIGMGLAALHPRVFHGDVSPKNIIIGADGHGILVDFDLASGSDELPMTQATGFPGTDPYASPEWRSRSGMVDARTDIFSLGMTAVYALYARGNLPSGLNDSRMGGPGPFIEKDLRCDGTIKSILARACALEPSARYQTVQQFCLELQRATRPSPRTTPATVHPRVAQEQATSSASSSTRAPRPVTSPANLNSTSSSSWQASDSNTRLNRQLPQVGRPGPVIAATSSRPTAELVHGTSPPLGSQQTRPAADRAASSATRPLVGAVQPVATVQAARSRVAEAPRHPGESAVHPAPADANSLGSWIVTMLVLAAGGAIFYGYGPPTPEQAAPEAVPNRPEQALADQGLSAHEVMQARTAVRNLGVAEYERARAALRNIADDRGRPARAITQARLFHAELLLTQVLARQIAAKIDPLVDAPLGAQAQATAELRDAEVLLFGLGTDADPDHLRRVQVLQALVQGATPDSLPPGSDELAAIIKAAPLWRGESKTPPSGLITSLRKISDPSLLTQSLLALALWRGGDIDQAQSLLLEINKRVDDHPLTNVMLAKVRPSEVTVAKSEPPAPEAEPAPVLTPKPKLKPKPQELKVDGVDKMVEPAAALVVVEPAAALWEEPRARLLRLAQSIGQTCRAKEQHDITVEIVTLGFVSDNDGQIVAIEPTGASAGLPLAHCIADELKKLQHGQFTTGVFEEEINLRPELEKLGRDRAG